MSENIEEKLRFLENEIKQLKEIFKTNNNENAMKFGVWSITKEERDRSIKLKWSCGESANQNKLTCIKIVRKTGSYPKDVNDGVLIYDNDGNDFLEDNDLINYLDYYYRFFVYSEGVCNCSEIQQIKCTPKPIIKYVLYTAGNSCPPYYPYYEFKGEVYMKEYSLFFIENGESKTDTYFSYKLQSEWEKYNKIKMNLCSYTELKIHVEDGKKIYSCIKVVVQDKLYGDEYVISEIELNFGKENREVEIEIPKFVNEGRYYLTIYLRHNATKSEKCDKKLKSYIEIYSIIVEKNLSNRKEYSMNLS